MSDNIQRSRGRGEGYKFDRGGMPTEFGPFIGIVKNNVDPARTGRLSVYIEQFGKGNPSDESLWRTVSYVPPFYGTTNPPPASAATAGNFITNKQSYGMWFTPPDIGTQVICFFVAGDPNQGYYIGCVPDTTVTHMLPAIGASRKYQLENSSQQSYFTSATQLPVTEINTDNVKISDNPRYFDQAKPVHSVLAGILLQQGLINDPIRGPITSNSQRESPSAVFGMSTPGKPVYQGGLTEKDIKSQLERGSLRPQDVNVIARRGGHSIVMDDGDLEGKDQLIRIRTAKGHQITMSDDGDCFFITHANGQTWLEFGKQGTVDVFSTNSVNIRTQGTLNLHADKNINIYAGGAISMKSERIRVQSESVFDIIGGQLGLYGKSGLTVKSDGTLALASKAGGWNGGSYLNFRAGTINLNSASAPPARTPSDIADVKLPDTSFVAQKGWEVEFGKLTTIVSRAPTHEPYPYHNQGINTTTNLSAPSPAKLTQGAATTLTSLDTVPVTNAINSADYLEINQAQLSVGSLDSSQVTGLQAAMVKQTDQAFNQVSTDKGIGRYGFTPTQLENAGYLKPGTVGTFLQNPANLTSVLSSPSVWTGKGNINSLNNLLVDPRLQDVTQNELMLGSYNKLKSAGIVSGNESPSNLGVFVQTATRYGVAAVGNWIQGRPPPDVAGLIQATAKNAQYAVNFVDNKASTFTTGVRTIGGFTDTINRGTVDAAVSSVIGNPKVPTPIYSGSLYSATPDSELFYSGSDPIVIERINAERRARNLPPLPTA